MKFLMIGCMGVLAIGQSTVQQMFDSKLTPTRRATVCYELRGNSDPDVIDAMSHALEDSDLLTCAVTNLRVAAAVEPLRRALTSPNAQVRAAAAREIGALQKTELIPALSEAAAEENLLVATNAVAGLSQYQDSAALPALTAVAKRGGMTGDMALERVAQLDRGVALGVARGLLSSDQVPDQLYAMRVIGSFGDSSDLPALQKIAGSPQETLSQHNRGFGFMPAINLARAAQSSMEAISAR